MPEAGGGGIRIQCVAETGGEGGDQFIRRIQAEILQLIKALQDEEKMGVLFITHDMGVVAEIADRTVVMFHGSVQGELVGDEMNEQAIMRLATGGQV